MIVNEHHRRDSSGEVHGPPDKKTR